MLIPKETDVLVVGGGPAGLAAAIAARSKGLKVAVADQRVPPIDKPCGEGLMPAAVDALERLGVSIETGVPFRGIRFLGDGASVDANFPAGHGLGVRRTALHSALVQRAAESGALLLWGVRVDLSAQAKVAIDGQEVRCRWVIGADGGNSRVRRWAGLDARRQESRRFAFRRHYAAPPWTDCMEIYWADGYQIYVTPVSRCEICVIVISRTPQLRLSDALARVPEIARRLAGAAPTSVETGAISATLSFPRIARERVILVGDASGSVDAITGDGLSMAFQQATALADALESGHLRPFERAHRRLSRRPRIMAKLMLSLDRAPWLRRRALPVFASHPAIFSNLLAMHVGALPASPRGWKVLCAG